MSRKIIREILSWALVFVVAFGLATLINRFVIFNVEVPSGSMEDTIMIGDRAVTSRLSYVFGDPKRGDIVVFPFPDDESIDYIKRIIGLPGETVEGRDGLVYIDGKPLNEPYVMAPLAQDFGPYVVSENSYFMMGDNRNNSADSRYWKNKYVSRDKMKGKALCRFPDFTWFGTVKY